MKNEIKKLAEEIYRAGVALDGSDFAHKSDHFERLAGKLYKAGYRKQSETVKEFAQKAISRVFDGISQRFYDCYNDGLIRDYPYSELSLNFFIAFNECKEIAKKEINELAEQYDKEE